MAKKPIILVHGNDPNCVHKERIVVYIGTCPICGQVRDYGLCQEDSKSELLVERGRKGGKAYGAIHSN